MYKKSASILANERIAAGRARTLSDTIDRLEEQEHHCKIEVQNNQMIQERK